MLYMYARSSLGVLGRVFSLTMEDFSLPPDPDPEKCLRSTLSSTTSSIDSIDTSHSHVAAETRRLFLAFLPVNLSSHRKEAPVPPQTPPCSLPSRKVHHYLFHRCPSACEN
ncbi:unnamed protein product [Haemonchus placei]|uniref:Ral guanine nucleotide dissociation stimulator-like 2 n=1 Tax=Haemonchus placei TaxID=6290 RepID=A0A0N4VTE7_HAEPC|nr:unnamed protein product [Haemonchus placei]